MTYLRVLGTEAAGVIEECTNGWVRAALADISALVVRRAGVLDIDGARCGATSRESICAEPTSRQEIVL